MVSVDGANSTRTAHKKTPGRSQVFLHPLGGPGEARAGGAHKKTPGRSQVFLHPLGGPGEAKPSDGVLAQQWQGMCRRQQAGNRTSSTRTTWPCGMRCTVLGGAAVGICPVMDPATGATLIDTQDLRQSCAGFDVVKVQHIRAVFILGRWWVCRRPSAGASARLRAPAASDGDAPDTPCLLYTSPSPRDRTRSRMPSSA